MSVTVRKDDAVARHTIIGYKAYPPLNLQPIDDDQGVEPPAGLYGRWPQARTTLDAVQRDVITHLHTSGGRRAIPEELWEQQDHADAAIAGGRR